MENVLFKISFPAEFHAQTAVECAMALHPQVQDRLDAHRAHRHRDAGTRRAHHRQDRSACESGGSRSLHPVHGGRAADLRPPHRRRLRRRGRQRSAHRPAAQQDGSAREHRSSRKEYYERDKRHIGNALHVFFSDGSPKLELRDRLSGRPSQAPRAKACRCWCRSSRPRWPRISRQDRPRPSRRCSRAGSRLAMPVNEFMAALVAN